MTEKSASTIVWHGKGPAAEVRCEAGALAEIAELAMSGYLRSAWGGVEIGGLLLGRKEAGTVHISHFRAAECEHHYGPAFDLSKKDSEAFERLLASSVAGSVECAEPAGLIPVGWYQTVSRHDLGLSEHARALFHRVFPEPWQIAMVVKRSKQHPLSIGVFVHDSHGRVEMHSRAQEFTLEALRQLESSAADPETPAQEPEPPQPAAVEPLAAVAATRLADIEHPAAAAARLPDIEHPAAAATPLADVEHPAPAVARLADVEHPAAAAAPGGIDLLASASTLPESPFSFFGLTADPFCTHPSTQFFYPSPQHREALAILFHRIRTNAGFLVLLGEPGMGKSIVLECLRDLLKAHATHFAVLLNSKISVTEFFELIAHDFRLPCASATKTATLIALNEYLLERSRAGLTTALVVDSAEKLSTQVLEEIELLGNLENRDGRLLQVVFAAQPSFERQLDAPELRGLKQRLMLRARLDPLDATQTAAYIEHRMMAAGGKNQSFFSSGVLAEIHRRAHGVPRLINALCSRLLASCRELQVKTAELSMLESIADDFAAGASGES